MEAGGFRTGYVYSDNVQRHGRFVHCLRHSKGIRMATTLAEILPAAAARHLDRTALIVNDRRLSFEELDVLSNRVANGLVAMGVQPGERVSLFGANSWEWVVAY